MTRTKEEAAERLLHKYTGAVMQYTSARDNPSSLSDKDREEIKQRYLVLRGTVRRALIGTKEEL